MALSLQISFTKPCKKCGAPTLRSNFHKCAERKDGLHPWCKPCARGWTNARYEQNKGRWSKTPERARADANLYYSRHPERVKAREKARRVAHPDQVRLTKAKSTIRATYGITRAQVMQMAADQGGLCAICGRQMGPGHHTHIDHDHATGAVRALLCTNCNTGLGFFRDDPALMRAATEYIERHARKVRAA